MMSILRLTLALVVALSPLTLTQIPLTQFPVSQIPLAQITVTQQLAFANSPSALPARPEPRIPLILSSTHLFAHLVSLICESECDSQSLVPLGEDPHLFELRPRHLLKQEKPVLIVYNGGDFEPWMDALLKSRFSQVEPLRLLDRLVLEVKHLGEKSGEIDPHAWMSPSNGVRYLESIAEKLIAISPAHRALFQKRLKLRSQEIRARAEYWKKQFAALASRKILTSHDAFQYFAKEFNLEIVAAQGWSTESEIQPQSLARLIQKVRTEKILVLFLESSGSPRLIEQIARETGAHIGGTLVADNLTQDISSYLQLIDSNAKAIHSALASNPNQGQK